MTMDASFRAKASACWPEMPDWVVELACFADQGGLKAAAARVGYSTSAISQVLSNSYGGNLDRFGDRVRGALMGATVTCPVDGEIARDACLDNQATPFCAAGSRAVALWRACRSGDCPHATLRLRQQKDVA